MYRWMKATRDDGKIIVLNLPEIPTMEFIPGADYTTIKFANGETARVQESVEELRSRLESLQPKMDE